jgi:hypothetical protein
MHQKCALSCGEPCIPCELPKRLSCSHISFDRFFTSRKADKRILLCQEVLKFHPNGQNSIQYLIEQGAICDLACDKKLNCNHLCIGLCGEVCPPICKICTKQKFVEAVNSLKPVTDKEMRKPSLIVLSCQHSFEVTAMDAYMSDETNFHNGFPICPNNNCSAMVNGVFRYSNIIFQYTDKNRPIQIETR